MGSINFQSIPSVTNPPEIPGAASIGYASGGIGVGYFAPLTGYRFLASAASTNGFSNTGGVAAPTTSGTIADFNDGEFLYEKCSTTGVLGAGAGILQGNFYAFGGTATPSSNLVHMFKIKTSTDLSSQRIWGGLCSADITYASADVGVGNFASVRYSTSAGDTTWKLCTRDNVTTNVVDTGLTVVADTTYDFRFFYDGTTWTVYISIDGQATFPYTASSATNTPSKTVALGFINKIYTTVAAIRYLNIQSVVTLYK